jgi:phosphoglycolate phosphatase-like HAD superfamily hydrolase
MAHRPEPAPDLPVAVFDIDGVLADVAHRLPHLQRRPKDWAAFFAAAPADAPLLDGVALARRLEASCEIVYLTGRPESCRRDTLAWLTRHGLPEGRLLMRQASDRRTASLVKLELLRRLAAGRRVEVVVDDDPAVCQAAARAGYPVRLADWASRPVELDSAQGSEGRS